MRYLRKIGTGQKVLWTQPDYVSRLELKVVQRNVELAVLAICCWLLIVVSLYARHRVNEARAIIKTYEESTYNISSDLNDAASR